MSRKDLSRTVIEGGRYYHNSHARRASHGIERARTRTWLDRVRADDDTADATSSARGPRVPKQFRDKLGPAKRWLGAQVGRPWNAVYSELRARFDARTIAGRHVVHDHMLPWVVIDEVAHRTYRPPFFVDSRGILRGAPSRGELRRLRDDAKRWANGRRAIVTYRGWLWFRFVPRTICTAGWTCPHGHVYLDHIKLHELRLVEDAAMTRGEVRRLHRLPPDLRAQIVIAIGAGTGLAARAK